MRTRARELSSPFCFRVVRGASILGCGLGVACSVQSSPPKLNTLPRIEIPFEVSVGADQEKEEAPPPQPIPKTPAPEKTVATDAPDPPAIRTKEQLELHLAFDQGELRLLGIEEKPQKDVVATPRRVGRFAVEWFVGPELIERVRFDFPLLGGASSNAGIERGLSAEARVLVPIVPRATRGRVLDRKTRNEIEVVWPPAPPVTEPAPGATPEAPTPE